MANGTPELLNPVEDCHRLVRREIFARYGYSPLSHQIWRTGNCPAGSASDEDRGKRAKEWPKDTIPPKERPCSNRHWRLPKGPF